MCVFEIKFDGTFCPQIKYTKHFEDIRTFWGHMRILNLTFSFTFGRFFCLFFFLLVSILKRFEQWLINVRSIKRCFPSKLTKKLMQTVMEVGIYIFKK